MWSGTITSVVADPDATQSDNALLLRVGEGESGWAGATTVNLGGYINLDEWASITLDVYPTTEGDLIVQLYE